MQVRITAAMVREFDDRGLNYAPFDRMTKPGTYQLTQGEAAELRADAGWHGDVDDCSGIEYPAATKAMYRRLHEQLT